MSKSVFKKPDDSVEILDFGIDYHEKLEDLKKAQKVISESDNSIQNSD